MAWWISLITAIFLLINLLLMAVAADRRIRKGRHFTAVDRHLEVWQSRLQPWLEGTANEPPPVGQTPLDREAVEKLLVNRLDQLPADRRAAAVDYLVQSGNVNYRLRGLTDKRWWVKVQAANVLGVLRVAAAREPLETLLDDGHPEVRQVAVRALGRLADPQSLEALLRLAHRGLSDCREYLIAALRSLGPSAHAALLHTLAMPGKSEAHLIALRVLQDAAEPEVAEAIAGLVLRSDDDELLYWGLEALERVGTLRPEAAGQAAERALSHRLPLVRAAAARALGRLRDPGALHSLEKTLRDEDWLVRRASARALNGLGSIAYPALERGLLDPTCLDVISEEAQISGLCRRLVEEMESPDTFKPAYRLLAVLLKSCGNLRWHPPDDWAELHPEVASLVRELLAEVA